MKIIEIKALQILDSRGNPTLKISVMLEDGSKGEFQVPSGASTGIHEALEKRDNNPELYLGKSEYEEVKRVNSIKENLYNKNFSQFSLDKKLIEIDGTENKSNLGANVILGISIAFAKASAKYYSLPLHEYLNRIANNISMSNKSQQKLPNIHLFANVINGGLHSGNELNIQEFMILPIEGTVNEKIQMIAETYQYLKNIIETKYGKSNTAVGDEGGFAPSISKNKEALDLLTQAIKEAGFTNKIAIALDAAASDFYNKDKKYEIEKKKKLEYRELSEYYLDLVQKYPIISIEDPMSEDDFRAFNYFKRQACKTNSTNPISKKDELLIVGDDLLVTNPKRIEIAVEKELCNSLLLKINQIGTLTESLEAWKIAKENGWHIIVSHRSGETTDSFISDLAVALEASIKIGAPARGERVAKYNRLLEIYQYEN